MEIAFIIPCHNEEASVGLVVANARSLFPESVVYVCDNCSTDRTSQMALDAGAHVLTETKRGKGNAVKRLMRDVSADIYIMVDGDDTYNLSNLPEAVSVFVGNRYDLMTGNRMQHSALQSSSFRLGHKLGNKLFTLAFRILFGTKTGDAFSGLRIMSKRLVKSFPIISNEFEIETELTIYAAKMNIPAAEFPASVKDRVGSESKLRSARDGLKILFFTIRLLHREFPLRLYAFISLAFFGIGLYVLIPIYIDFLLTGIVLRFPSLVLAISLMVLSALAMIGGLVLKEISNLKYEGRYLSYLRSES
jgi:glycosyltransferase involved in cell wall biosynthesis